MVGLSLFVLAAACIHEFAWQLLPAGLGLQGNLRSVTQWVLICALLWTVHVLARNRFTSSVCMAVGLMSSTTAGCSAYWLLTRFITLPGEDQCSKVWGVPMLLVSACAALAVFWRWPNVKQC